MPGKKQENKGRTERDIDTRKSGSLAVIVCRKAIVQTAQGEKAGRRDVRKRAWGGVTKSPQKGWCRLKSTRRRGGGEAAEPWRPDPRRKLGYLGRVTPNTQCKSGEGKTKGDSV